MSSTGNGGPGQQGPPPWAGQPGQYNTANSGNVYATQGGNININTTPAVTRGLRVDTKALLVVLPADVIFFFYGMLAYTGKDTTGDTWRAGIFLVMFLLTATMIGRWIRRRV
jgi:hypothetical protein